MGSVYRMSRILVLAVLLLIGWIPAGAAAFTPGDFNVSPQSIDIGTVRVLPGQAAGPYSFNIAVVGGPVPDPPAEGAGEEVQEEEKEKTAFSAATDSHWITLSPAEGESPGAITAVINLSETMGEGTWRGNITILSGLDPSMDPVSIPVSMTVLRSVGDLLTVSPASLDLTVSGQNAEKQTFPIKITNADPDKTGFDWSAQSDTPWLTLSSFTGTGNTTVSLIVDPRLLPLSEDFDGDGIMDGATGTVTFRSNLNSQQTSDPEILTVTMRTVQSTDLSVHPGQLYWSIEKDAAAGTVSLEPQTLQVFSGPAGWTAATDVHFLSLNREGGGQVSTDPYGRLTITPLPGLIQGMGYGNHTGTVTISDRYSQLHRNIPVTINIRRPGDPVSPPVPGPVTYQISPYYSMIEVPAAGQVYLHLPVPDGLAYYPTAAMCTNAGGQWRDPDGIPGNLDEHCSLNQQVYVLMEFPQMAPGLVYAWNRFGEFALAFQNGIKTQGADDHTYADGPVPVIPVGPVQLLEYHGTMVISTRVGQDLNTAVENQRIQINLRTLEGLWRVTEIYNGMYYSYDSANLLSLIPTPGQPGYYTGSWGSIPVTVTPGDGISLLHQLDFSMYGVHFTYQVQSLTANQLSGRWQFKWPGGTGNWETFQAQRHMPLP